MDRTKKELITAYNNGEFKGDGEYVESLTCWSYISVILCNDDYVFGYYGYQNSKDEIVKKFFRCKIYSSLGDEPRGYFFHNEIRHYLDEFMYIGGDK